MGAQCSFYWDAWNAYRKQNCTGCYCCGNDDDEEKLLGNNQDTYQQVQVDPREEALEELRLHFKADISKIFWLMAGQEPYSKKTLYMRKNELQEFLQILDIYNESTFDQVFRDMNSETDNNAIEFSEFVNYFCDSSVNPDCHKLRDEIIQSTDWQLMRKSLKIFDIIDKDKSGEIIYQEFTKFCQLINITDEDQMQQLFQHIDKDGSHSIKLKELLLWFKERLKVQSDNRHGTNMAAQST